MSGAQNSAGREAAALRRQARGGPVRRILAHVGFDTVDHAMMARADRFERGGITEQETAAMLAQLRERGWHVLNDRQLPGWGRTNLDHVLIPPNAAAVVVLDTKGWDFSRTTSLVGGRVCCGREDRHDEVEKVVRYSLTVARLLRVPAGSVWPLLVVHGSRIQSPGFPPGRLEAPVRVTGRRGVEWEGRVHVLGPPWLVPTLAGGPKTEGDPEQANALARHVAAVLPPHR